MRALVVAAAALLAAAPAAAADCPNADARPGEISVTDYSTALLCVVNATRGDWGRPELAPQRNLQAAASWHASDMADNDYFAHAEPDGGTFADRLLRAHFIPEDSDRWAAGENLAAGEGGSGTPQRIVAGWVGSREHRLNLLDPDFTMVGIGVARGWPTPADYGSDAVTIDLSLGWRLARRRPGA